MILSTCTHLPWDSNFWGFPIARLNTETLHPNLLQEATGWCTKNQIKCLYYQCDGHDPETLQLASDAGFKFVDMRVDLEITLSENRVLKSKSKQVRSCTAEDCPTVQEIAKYSHTDTRFFKDGNFDRDRASELYSRWIEKDFRENLVLISINGHEAQGVSGYVTCLVEPSGNGRIGLIGISEPYRGKGIGRELLNSALDWFFKQDVRHVKVATQGTNITALRLYERAGFTTSDVKIWYHKWFPIIPDIITTDLIDINPKSLIIF